MTFSSSEPWPLAQQLLTCVIAACDPRALVRREARAMHAPIAVLAVGKAAASMALGLQDASAGPIADRALLVLPDAIAPPPAFEAIVSDHPLPSARSELAARRVLRWLDRLAPSLSAPSPHARLVLLLSGGASALLCAPISPLSLDDIRALTRSLLRAGADIHTLNTVRRHADALKGGRLARRISDAARTPAPRIDALVLSDVLGDPPADIASGPVSPDPTTRVDAVAALRAHLPLADPADRPALARVIRALEDDSLSHQTESLKPGDPALAGVTWRVLANNSLAVRAAVEALRAEGFDARAIPEALIGDAAHAGRHVAHTAAHQLPRASGARPRALVWGGETTVRVGPAPADQEPPGAPERAHTGAYGGRNQELALAAVMELARLGADHIHVVTLATDGADGVAPPAQPVAAGAALSAPLLRAAAANAIDPADALHRHDSYTWLARAHARGLLCHLRPGPTGTNVNDVTIAWTR